MKVKDIKKLLDDYNENAEVIIIKDKNISHVFKVGCYDCKHCTKEVIIQV